MVGYWSFWNVLGMSITGIAGTVLGGKIYRITKKNSSKLLGTIICCLIGGALAVGIYTFWDWFPPLVD